MCNWTRQNFSISLDNERMKSISYLKIAHSHNLAHLHTLSLYFQGGKGNRGFIMIDGASLLLFGASKRVESFLFSYVPFLTCLGTRWSSWDLITAHWWWWEGDVTSKLLLLAGLLSSHLSRLLTTLHSSRKRTAAQMPNELHRLLSNRQKPNGWGEALALSRTWRIISMLRHFLSFVFHYEKLFFSKGISWFM